MKAFKRKWLLIPLLLAAVFSLLTLTGCVGGNLSRKLNEGKVYHKNGDGTKTTMTYENAGALLRAPQFRTEEYTLVMRFNGTDWFTAEIVTPEELAPLDGAEVLAQSENLTYYFAPGYEVDPANPPFYEDQAYWVVMNLNGTRDSVILFKTADGPWHDRGYGSDFKTVRYDVDGKETVPSWENLRIFVDDPYIHGDATDDDLNPDGLPDGGEDDLNRVNNATHEAYDPEHVYDDEHGSSSHDVGDRHIEHFGKAFPE
ncbi:MAG: hypothetical protein Q4B73_06090 [Lachnospiraceae bacterium]|nr:hypothetical protein [Lachnospiraceae bacterium]